jgi:hypothetical protein
VWRVISSIDDIRQRTWDFALTIATVLLLGGLGIQSFAGTLYTWWAIRSVPGWQQGGGYVAYVDTMNAIAAPLIVGLVVVMGLCVPKRLFSRRGLVWVSLGMVAAGVATGATTKSLVDGLTVYLLLAAAIQLAVVVLTVAGVRGPSYLTEGRLTKTGSGLLHLGFVLFAIVVVALQKSAMMGPVFWTSTVLVVGGTALSFYANALSQRRARPDEEALFSAGEADGPLVTTGSTDDAEQPGEASDTDEGEPGPTPGESYS